MYEYFKINNNKIVKSDNQDFNWLVMKDINSSECKEIIEKYQLPEDIFLEKNSPEDVSRFEKIHGSNLSDPILVNLIDLSLDEDNIEECFQSNTFIYTENLLILRLSSKTKLLEQLLDPKNEIHQAEEIIMKSILFIYGHYTKKLHQEKEKIDYLDKEARESTESEELFKLADVKRTMVYLEHTLTDQKETVNQLLENKSIMAHFKNNELIYDVKLSQNYTNKMVQIYRDLLDSIADLISDMIDNNLNHIMKYLDSATLIISIPTLFYGLWGMNTGGLPGKGENLGTLLVVLLSLVATLIVGVHLSRKKYSN